MLTSELRERAVELWPDNESLQKKWLNAVAFLLVNNRWILRGAEVSWKS